MKPLAHTGKAVPGILIAGIFGVLLFAVLRNSADPAGDTILNTARTALGSALISLLLGIFSFFSKKPYRFSVVDAGVICLSLYLLANYLANHSAAIGRLYQGIALFCLYFDLRIALQYDRKIAGYLVLIFLFSGLWEAFTGLKQLYGFSTSHHSLYKITGTFFNPGPYAGYLAVVLAVSAYLCIAHYSEQSALLSRLRSRETFRQISLQTVIWLTATVTASAIVLVLPATMSRASWLSAAVPLCIMAAVRGRFVPKIGRWRKKRPVAAVLLCITCGAVLAGALGYVYDLKRGSADGRLLMWKIETNALLQKPFFGVGAGYFGEAFAQAQTAYFTQERSENEIAAAGCPEYGFNEYLQTGIETGITGLALALIVAGISLRGLFSGKNSYRKAAGYGFTALLIFSCFSYPLSVPVFWIAVLFFMASAESKIMNFKPNPLFPLPVLFAAQLYVWLSVRPVAGAYREWQQMRILYEMQHYESLPDDYGKIEKYLRHNYRFMFEYGHLLNKTGQYGPSNRILEQGARLNCDPMFYNIMGNNHKELGETAQAEACYQKAYRLLPNRIYPLYLLAKLSIETGQAEKSAVWAEAVEKFDPKISSQATREMKSEIRKLFSSKYGN